MNHAYLGSYSHRSRGKQIGVGGMCGQQAKLGLVDKVEEILDLLLEGGLFKVLLCVWIGILGAGVGVAEARRHGGCTGDALRESDG